MKKIFALLITLTFLVTTLAACSGSTSKDAANPKEEATKQKEIVVILKNNTAPFFISVAEGAKAAGEELGANVTVKTPVETAEGSGNEQQIQLAEETIVSKADCVVMCPVDSQAIIPVMKQLKDANIPVVNLNTRISDNTMYKTFVGLENYNQGYDTAKALFEGMGKKGKIFIIEGSTGAQTSIDRVKGALAAVEEYPDIQVVAQQSANYSRAEAMNVVQNLLQSYPDVNGIFCCNDEMALGSVEAVDAAGKTGSILISGQDANDDACAAIREGKIYVTSFGNPYMQGYTSVQAAIDLLGDKEVKDFYEVQTLVVDKKNVDTFKDKK
ncbi:MAG TPA: sugar ABC transporter substrate-binding protein [Lachnospiraceae bacterium]|nr:sugar ABC transporter substrate-binding protein [Lachnospiraceae bacterium]HBR01134.1 sugar ABC transporter substrate-binding protein [Ruminiclostridium sp.]